MAEIKALSEIVAKWVAVTPLRADQYRLGVASPKRDWAAESIAANDVYVRGVTVAAQAGRYAGGVRRVGTTKWQDRTLAKGPHRFSEGVMMAGPDFEAGFAPFHAEIAKTVLPPAMPKGDPANIQRCAVIAAALHAKKIALRA